MYRDKALGQCVTLTRRHCFCIHCQSPGTLYTYLVLTTGPASKWWESTGNCCRRIDFSFKTGHTLSRYTYSVFSLSLSLFFCFFFLPYALFLSRSNQHTLLAWLSKLRGPGIVNGWNFRLRGSDTWPKHLWLDWCFRGKKLLLPSPPSLRFFRPLAHFSLFIGHLAIETGTSSAIDRKQYDRPPNRRIYVYRRK